MVRIARALSLVLLPAAAAASAPSDRIRADVNRLASTEWEGRRAGTPGGEAAADWISAELRRIGLQPGAGEGYAQEFSFIDGVVLGPGNRLEGPSGRAWKAGEDFRPLAFSAPGSASAGVVFAGYGIVSTELERDDYAGLDAKGKLVLLLRHGPEGDDPQSRWAAFTALRLKASTARDHGARAVLVVTGRRTSGAKDELVPLRADASLTDAGLPIVSVRRAVAEAVLAPSGVTLEEAQRRADERAASFAVPESRVDLVADVTPKRAITRNLLGLLPAPAGAGGILVVGAHYDHLGLGMSGSLDAEPEGKVHPGADDNASGMAALLELARRLAPRREALRRSVLFAAFGAEEQGALGSSHFVKAPPASLGPVAAMVNLDMVGRLREDTLHVHGVGTSPVWSGLLEEAKRRTGLETRVREGGYGPSDHNPFYVAGIPVLFAFTGTHADYHRPSDTAERIDAAGIARVVDLVEAVVTGLATTSDAIAFTRVAREKEQASPARGFRVTVGGIPDYTEEGVGVRFSGVMPGSPAEKAGVQAGDVLVRFGEKEIRNIYDYTYALGERKPGETVRVVVRRGTEEMALEVTLGARASAGR